MKHRLLLKAFMVLGMGIATFFTGAPARAASMEFCYQCYHADICPDGELGNALCQDLGGELCPYYNTCVELAPECRYGAQQWMLITCAPNP